MHLFYIILIFGISLILISLFSCGCNENFSQFKKKSQKGTVQLGVEKGTPGSLQKIIKDLQKIGMQADEDTKYDTVADDYLNPANIP